MKPMSEIVPAVMEGLKPASPEVIAAERQRENQLKVSALRYDWNAPKRHLANSKDLKRDNAWGQCEASLKARLGTGFLVALVGVSGPGKTQLGVELMIAVTDAHRRALYCTASQFLREVKDTFKSDGNTTETTVLAKYLVPSLLVIDESEKRSDSDWANETLYSLVDGRYMAKKDTLLISNLDKAAFCNATWPSIASRMNETGGIIACNWPTFRQ